MFGITPSARLRPSPFYEATLRDGVTAFTTYNHMLMPTSFGHPEAEYWRLIEGVSMWDVAVERQVELVGPDAAQLAQILCPRKVGGCKEGQGKYVALCNHKGVLINDPILLKLADDRYWLSIADSNIWFWARAIAAERELDVEVNEPDASPLAVQGPQQNSAQDDLLQLESGAVFFQTSVNLAALLPFRNDSRYDRPPSRHQAFDQAPHDLAGEE